MKLTIEEIQAIIEEAKKERAAMAGEAIVEKEEEIEVEAPPIPEVLEEVEVGVEKIEVPERITPEAPAEERITELIELGERISNNYYASRGYSIIEFIFPTEYAAEVETIIYRCKIDPKAPEVMLQDPAFAETQPEFAHGIGAYQLSLDRPSELVSSGYDVIKAVKLLKNLPVIFTTSTTIKQKAIIDALKNK